MKNRFRYFLGLLLVCCVLASMMPSVFADSATFGYMPEETDIPDPNATPDSDATPDPDAEVTEAPKGEETEAPEGEPTPEPSDDPTGEPLDPADTPIPGDGENDDAIPGDGGDSDADQTPEGDAVEIVEIVAFETNEIMPVLSSGVIYSEGGIIIERRVDEEYGFLTYFIHLARGTSISAGELAKLAERVQNHELESAEDLANFNGYRVLDIRIENYGTITESGSIGSGMVHISISNKGVIEGGTYNCSVSNQQGGVIEGGIYTTHPTNHGTVRGGTFTDGCHNYGTIEDGTFTGGILWNYDTITGGTFSGEINNGDNYSTAGTITGGTFESPVNNNNNGSITGGTFKENVANSGSITGGTFEGGITGNGTVNIPDPTATPTPTEKPDPTEEPAATATPKPTVTPRPTATPAPTAVPAPAPTAAPEEKLINIGLGGAEDVGNAQAMAQWLSIVRDAQKGAQAYDLLVIELPGSDAPVLLIQAMSPDATHLSMTLAQMVQLCERQGAEILVFRNGDAAVYVPLSGIEQLLAQMEPSAIAEQDPANSRLELYAEAVTGADGSVAGYRICALLYAVDGANPLDVTAMIPGLRILIAADALGGKEIVYVDATGARTPLGAVYAAGAEQAIAQRYAVTWPELSVDVAYYESTALGAVYELSGMSAACANSGMYALESVAR